MKIYTQILLFNLCCFNCLSQTYSKEELKSFKSFFLSSIDVINNNWEDSNNDDFSFNYQYSKIENDSLEFTFYRFIQENDTLYRNGFTLKYKNQDFGFIFYSNWNKLQDIIDDINPKNLMSILFFENNYVPTKVLRFYQSKVTSSMLVKYEENKIKLLSKIYLELIRLSDEIQLHDLERLSKEFKYHPFFYIFDSLLPPQNIYFIWEKLSYYRPGPIITINE